MQGCGHARVWSDIGFLRHLMRVDETCFYPSLHEGVLEAFHDSHPYGTLLQVVRNATEW
jgi:hypothetical protein